MSCSVHDLVRLERRGIPTAGVATKPFLDEALLQAQALAMPDLRLAYVRHPVQLLTTAAIHSLAEQAIPEITQLLTSHRPP